MAASSEPYVASRSGAAPRVNSCFLWVAAECDEPQPKGRRKLRRLLGNVAEADESHRAPPEGELAPALLKAHELLVVLQASVHSVLGQRRGEGAAPVREWHSRGYEARGDKFAEVIDARGQRVDPAQLLCADAVKERSII